MVTVSGMKPPSGAKDGVLRYEDAFDVPVVVRSAPASRPRKPEQKAKQPWPSNDQVPTPGRYLATALWREILKHAAEVGRDVSDWLFSLPQLAGQELMARLFPLQAYLSLEHGTPRPHASAAGRRLTASVVYAHGTEVSARAAFAYRLGMSMAQWACRGLMGLGPTTHVEVEGPAGIMAFTEQGKRPDLWGRHSTDPQEWWLVEAKSAAKLGLPNLRNGHEQLKAGSALMGTLPHRLLLCGTSIYDYVFMTIDDIPLGAPGAHGSAAPGPASPDTPEDRLDDDDDLLLRVTEAHLLTYAHLRYGRSADLRLVPLSRRRPPHPDHRAGSLTAVEADTATGDIRTRLRNASPANRESLRNQPEFSDYLSAPVPGMDVHLGMSRELFGACERLFRERARVAEEELPPDSAARVRRPGLPDQPAPMATEDTEVIRMLGLDVDSPLSSVESAEERRFREARMRMEERNRRDRSRVREEVRRAYQEAQHSAWSEILQRDEPPLDYGAGRLEGISRADQSYISIRASGPLLNRPRSQQP